MWLGPRGAMPVSSDELGNTADVQSFQSHLILQEGERSLYPGHYSQLMTPGLGEKDGSLTQHPSTPQTFTGHPF